MDNNMLVFSFLLGACFSDSKQEHVGQMDFEEIKEIISLGLSKKEVKELVGEPTGIAKENSLEGIPDNPEYWRYDFLNNGYTFNADTPDGVDIEGLQSGDMKMQLRLSWTSGFFSREVASYSIFYKDNDGLVYRYYSDGTHSVYDSEKDEFIDIQK